MTNGFQSSLFDDHSPTPLELLLSQLGWMQSSRTAGLYSAWVSSREDSRQKNVEILAPLDPSKGDFAYMESRALDYLKESYGAEKISQRYQMTTLAQDLDLTSWKLETDKAGMISFPQGERMHESIQGQLSAAAKSRQKSRAVHGSASALAAKDFLSKSYLAAPIPGSFIIPAYTPISSIIETSRAKPKRTGPGNGAQLFTGRDVIQTLDSALTVVSSALHGKNSDRAAREIASSTQFGISLELIESLILFASDGPGRIEATRSAPDAKTREIEFFIHNKRIPVLREAAEILAGTNEPKNESFKGAVTAVSRDKGDPEGTVKIVAEGAQAGRRVRVKLVGELYEVALRAHKDELTVQVSGDVRRDGRFTWIDDPETFQVDESTAADHANDDSASMA